MGTADDSRLDALRMASRAQDAAGVARIWRELTPADQESVVFKLLGMQVEDESAPSDAHPDEEPRPPVDDLADTAAMDGLDQTENGLDQTELVPQGFEDLRGLATPNGDEDEASAGPAPSGQSTEYWSRWRQRWKWSAVVAAWAVTTVFAFTADTTVFGPLEWIVSLAATVVGGGLLVGTLINFVVAMISTRPSEPKLN